MEFGFCVRLLTNGVIPWTELNSAYFQLKCIVKISKIECLDLIFALVILKNFFGASLPVAELNITQSKV